MLNQIIGRSNTDEILLKSLDARMERNRVISNNIANAETPGFQKRKVSFEATLRNTINKNALQGRKTRSGHMDVGGVALKNLKHDVYRSYDPTFASGVNNVDIDSEMADLAENQIGYKYGIKLLKSRHSILDAAIRMKSAQ